MCRVCCLMEESGNYGVSGALWGYLWGTFSSGGRVDGLCVWVDM